MYTPNLMTKNLISNILVFIVNILISFFLTPYLIDKLGAEPYGFISLATNVINYASIITLALNSVSGRFIAIEIHKNNLDEASKIFTTVFTANLILSIIIFIPSMLIILNIDKIINISHNLIFDVKVLFIFLLLNFLASVIFSNFSIATFATNKLYLSSMRLVESQIAKVLIILTVFTALTPSILYIGISTVVATLYVVIFNIRYTRKFLPYISFGKRNVDKKILFILFSSGIWNSLLRLGQVLSDGVGLVISNIYLGVESMGKLAIALTIPTIIYSFANVLAGLFLPDFTFYYAKGDNLGLLKKIKDSISLMGIFISLPLALIFTYGDVFYTLWIPSQEPNEIYLLSVLLVSHLIISGGIYSLYNIFTITNHLKANSIVNIVSGILNIILVLVSLKFTSLGLYAVAVMNSILGTIINLTFTPIYTARILRLKWHVFYLDILKSVLAFVIILNVGYFIRYTINSSGWIGLVINSILTVSIGLTLNVFIILSKENRRFLLDKFIKSIRK